MTTNQEWLFSLTLEEYLEWMESEHYEPNPDCSAMLYKTFTGNMCSHYEPKDGVVAILREAARNLSDYHDAGEALRRLTDTTNVYHALETLADMIERDYVRRESVEEVMDNDRALVEENSMLARELLKLRAELDAAKQQISQFDAPKSVETSEKPASKCEISDFDDSRERLEAEIESYSAFDMMDTITLDMVIGWLDRQAAITEREVEHDLMKSGRMAVEVERERIKKLTAERDNWKANCEDWKNHARAAENACYETMLEREDYRKKFGKCIDYADAIHALMDDEGMA